MRRAAEVRGDGAFHCGTVVPERGEGGGWLREVTALRTCTCEMISPRASPAASCPDDILAGSNTAGGFCNSFLTLSESFRLFLALLCMGDLRFGKRDEHLITFEAVRLAGAGAAPHTERSSNLLAVR